MKTSSNVGNWKVRNLLWSVGIALAVTIAGCAVGAWIIAGQVLPESSAATLSLSVLLLASLVGSLMTGKHAAPGCLLISLLFSGIFVTVLLTLQLILFDGDLSGLWPALLPILAGTGVSAWIKSRMGQSKNKSIKRMKKRTLYKMHN